MARGDVLPSEAEESTDPRTGVRVRRVTSHPSIHHHPFYYLPAYDDAMRHLVFVSHRTRPPAGLPRDPRERGARPAHRPRRPERVVDPPLPRRRLGLLHRRGRGLAGVDADVRGGAPGELRHPVDPGGGHGGRGHGHDDPEPGRPLVGGAGALRRGDPPPRHRHPDRGRRGDPGARLDRPPPVPPRRPEAPALRRAPTTPGSGSSAATASGNRLAYERDAAKKEWIVHETWVPGTRRS